VERALRLVATGTLTIDMVHAAKGKAVNLPKTMNLGTGKESMRQTGFSDVAWGKATRNYAKSACSLPAAKFDVIIKEAKEFMKPIRGRKTTQATEVIDVDEDDERACLVDNSGDESDQCKLFDFPLLTHRAEDLFRICIVVCGPCKYINPHSILSHLHAIARYHAGFNSGFVSFHICLDYAWTCLAHKYALISLLFLSLNNCSVSE
jgi:hypothetical protein